MPQGGANVTFINCDFGENGGVHTNTQMSKSICVHLINCKGHGFRIGDNASNANNISTYRFDNCDLLWLSHRVNGNTPHAVIRGSGNGYPLLQIPLNVLYDIDGVVLVPKSRLNLPVGTIVEWYGQDTHGPRYRAATSIDNAKGVVVYTDNENTYVQYAGYVRTDRVGLSTFALNDYIGLSGVVQTADVAYGRIAYIDSDGYGYIRLDWR